MRFMWCNSWCYLGTTNCRILVCLPTRVLVVSWIILSTWRYIRMIGIDIVKNLGNMREFYHQSLTSSWRCKTQQTKLHLLPLDWGLRQRHCNSLPQWMQISGIQYSRLNVFLIDLHYCVNNTYNHHRTPESSPKGVPATCCILSLPTRICPIDLDRLSKPV